LKWFIIYWLFKSFSRLGVTYSFYSYYICGVLSITLCSKAYDPRVLLFQMGYIGIFAIIFFSGKFCYRTVCSLGKSQPKHQVCDTTGDTYHCHLNRYPLCFSVGKVQHKGGFSGDPKGIAKEKLRRRMEHPIGHNERF